MDPTGLAPRRAAHYLLGQVIEEGRLMSELIGAGALDRLVPEDRARAQRLALDTLRTLERADRMLKPFLQRKPPLAVQNVLRLGTLEICTGTAAHGVVNACVEIVGRSKRTMKYRGLVNAVLRKIDAAKDGWDKLPVSVMPRWLRRPLTQAWGDKALQQIERAHFAGAPLDLTLNGPVPDGLPGEALPSGSWRIRDGAQVSLLPGYKSGDWWVQDAAAALPVRLMAPQKGEKVVDLCAAPGGKTMQMAAAGADVTAVDVSEGRMARVRENLKRTGLTAKCVVSDAFAFEGEGFDAVLLDAPCSATGTIRRHPDLPYAKDGAEFAELIAQQGDMIDHALTMLKPGGRLVFCTCSLLPDEGEVQIDDALDRHPDLVVDRDALNVDGVDPDWITEEGGLRLRPDFWQERGGMDGFYMAVLRKPA